MMETDRDEPQDWPLRSNSHVSDTIVFCVGDGEHNHGKKDDGEYEKFQVPNHVSLGSPYLAKRIPRPYGGAPIHLPNSNIDDFRRYTNFLLFTLPLAQFLPRGPKRAHPLENTLTWSECLPLIDLYVFAERIRDEAFLRHIRGELEKWLCRRKKDFRVLEYVVTTQGVGEEVKTWVVSRMYRNVDDVPDLLRRYWRGSVCDEGQSNCPWGGRRVYRAAGGAQGEDLSGAPVSSISRPAEAQSGGRLVTGQRETHGGFCNAQSVYNIPGFSEQKESGLRVQGRATVLPNRGRRHTHVGNPLLPPFAQLDSHVYLETDDAITALPTFPYRKTRPSSERFHEGIPRSDPGAANMTLGQVPNKQPEVEQEHGVCSHAARIAKKCGDKAPPGRRKRLSMKFLKGFVEVRGAPTARGQQRGTQLWIPMV